MPALQTIVSGLAGLLEAAAAPLPPSATPFSGLRPISVDACTAQPGKCSGLLPCGGGSCPSLQARSGIGSMQARKRLAQPLLRQAVLCPVRLTGPACTTRACS